jgi:hypothetical protein
MFDDIVGEKDKKKESKSYIDCISCNRKIIKGLKCPWCNPPTEREDGL